MKRVCFGAALALLSASGLAWAQAGGDTAEKTVAANENIWLQSQKTNNPDLIAPLLAEKFVQTDDSGRVTNKAETLDEARKTKWTSAEYEDVHVTVVGNTAIATGGFRGTGTSSTGKPLDLHARWTDTWVKMPDGKWQCLASQDGPIQQ